MTSNGWNNPSERLRQLVARDISEKPFSELSSVAFDHDGPDRKSTRLNSSHQI